ncbi:hypothetical protein [Sphingomonas sp.]|uniref:hypothetical protein n=1 Tax=Sphingomonas sp. TaxID=28214 RepID=UPI0025F93BCE|nr:hypothetical protein [Sphingomonas sp.]
MKMHDLAAVAVMVALPFGGTPAAAQEKSVYLADSASPFGVPTVTNADAQSVTMPKLDYTPSGTEAADFDKYYVFHRADTDFATAYGDIAECDNYARGLQSGISDVQVPYPYAGTMAGALGGAIGSAVAMAIFGSAEKRRLRRVNMRTCMNFKGYDRYGLPKALWDEFNFEEGLSGVNEEKRQHYLKQQALVASSGKLQGKVLGL